jgi:hypothetical protein
MVMSCKRAAELTSRELDVPLRVYQRLALCLHRVLCPACRRFRRQLAELHRAIAQFLKSAGAPSAVRLSAVARGRIHQALRDETGIG